MSTMSEDTLQEATIEIDLNYEGIATSRSAWHICALFLPNRNRPELRRDCDVGSTWINRTTDKV